MRVQLLYDEREAAAFVQREVEVETSQQPLFTQQFDDGDYVEFFRAGTPVKGVFQCVSCQAVSVTVDVLRPCARCGEQLWERATWSPFSRASRH